MQVSEASLSLISCPFTLADIFVVGYSYNYLSPENLNLEQAYVGNMTLGPDSPAYKALLIYGTSNVTYDSISKIRQFAEADYRSS